MRITLVAIILISQSLLNNTAFSLMHPFPPAPKVTVDKQAIRRKVAQLAQQLIRIESVTPNDNGCQDIVKQHLEGLNFVTETLKYHDVTNLWAVHSAGGGPGPPQKPMVVFVGHTDVVPTGPLEQWDYPPFAGVINKDDILYGRGAVDMKGGIASFLVALESFLNENGGEHLGSIGVLLTSDEEGDAIHGTKMVLEELGRRGIVIDKCLVGEPSSSKKVGDIMKVGRRGSLGGELTINGIQGHVAYPLDCVNPIHESLGALKDLVDMEWDRGTKDFHPTSFQISNINSGTGATNVVPGFKKVVFNFRFSPASTEESLKKRVTEVLEKHDLDHQLHWTEISYPYETSCDSELVRATAASIHEVTGIDAKACTSGGTSDGRFVAATGAEVVELGPINKTIHKINEHVAIADLEILAEVYENLLGRLLQPTAFQVQEEEETIIDDVLKL